jgi:putative ATP-dependent endonuclease of OLD family
LGEGDSEEIVIPRVFVAHGIAADDSSVSIVPLGGRHVNHFWRLLHGLEIPYLTLLDLDTARYGGGWGRIKYCADNLLKFPPTSSTLSQDNIDNIPSWNDPRHVLGDPDGAQWIKYLESVGVFFSAPLDIDFSMMLKFSAAYGVDPFFLGPPDSVTLNSVLGRSHGDETQYTADQLLLFDDYHDKFKIGSKPSNHLNALSQIDDAALLADLPPELQRLAAAVATRLAALPE